MDLGKVQKSNIFTAMLAVYLASDQSAFTTGHIQLVDGGFAL
jgi:enoyl-[acyl-carrier-protein] reductase (NADH)